MKRSATQITVEYYDFFQHMSREKLCAERLHEMDSNPDFSIPFLGLAPLAVAAFVVAGTGALAAVLQAPFSS